ncbi:MAG TPA: hypothetical protein VHS78_14970 [Candidatus Elarobacter sp.]|jgi:hypothetical protein|nr:hypothetical protein [Candidatus Elarobacter sp.]
MRRSPRAIARTSLILTTALCLHVILSLSKDAPIAAQAASPTPTPSVLVATPSFLMYAEGDRRQPAVGGSLAGGYRILGTMSDGSALVSFDDGISTVVETVSPALRTRTLKTFARGTLTFRATDGFLTVESVSQLLRRYDVNGNLVGTPFLPLGVAEALGAGDSVVVLTRDGVLRVYDRAGHVHKELRMNANSLVALPDARFAVNDITDSEVRAYTTELEQTATLRYVGLPARALASAPDGTLIVLAGTPACVTSNAEIDVFTDLHAQPAARIHEGITRPTALAVSADFVYVANDPCRSDEDGSITAIARADKTATVMRQVGRPTSITPFTRK